MQRGVENGSGSKEREKGFICTSYYYYGSNYVWFSVIASSRDGNTLWDGGVGCIYWFSIWLDIY